MSPVILVAPAAFKGTLGPRQVADALARGVRRALPDASVLQCPISDGGDGLLDAVLGSAGLRARIDGAGPVGAPGHGGAGRGGTETAVLGRAAAARLGRLRRG